MVKIIWIVPLYALFFRKLFFCETSVAGATILLSFLPGLTYNSAARPGGGVLNTTLKKVGTYGTANTQDYPLRRVDIFLWCCALFFGKEDITGAACQGLVPSEFHEVYRMAGKRFSPC
ncbi:MAG: hypothetical protein ACOX4Z_04625 [Desulfobulbus sp.]|jgi:hypothetical protein